MSAPVLERIRPCEDCGRMTRPSSTRAGDYPGTLVRGNATLCVTCYVAQKPAEAASLGREASKEVVFATVTERYPQRSDCRASCCKTPYNCARGFTCACHGEGS